MTPLAQAIDRAIQTGLDSAAFARIEIHFYGLPQEEPEVNVNIFGLLKPWSEPRPPNPVPLTCGGALSKA